MQQIVSLVSIALAGTGLAAGLDRTVIDTRSGIPIICANQPDMFPSTWQVEPINATATEIIENEVGRSQEMMKRALAKYPVPVLKKHLKRVFVSREIKFYNLPYGGTNSLDTVYLANDGKQSGYSDLFLEGSLHHEFSSILLRNLPKNLDQRAWDAALPKGFAYRGDGTQSVREGTASTRYKPEFHAQGFLAQYATSSQEEDFNMLAEALFTGQNRFWDAVDENPALKTKVNLVIDFYTRLDPTFNEDFFRRMVRTEIQESGHNANDGR